MKIKKPETLIIIQARQNSSRFPNKVLIKINKTEIINIILYRLSKLNFPNRIVVAIPNNNKNLELKKWLIRNKIEFFTGPESDVLTRFYQIASKIRVKNIIRITADCPFIEPSVINKCVKKFEAEQLDYLKTSNNFPDGLDVEIFTKTCLIKSHTLARNRYEREHVTPFMSKSKTFKISTLDFSKKIGHLRLTLDEPIDLILLEEIAKYFDNFDFNLEDIIELSKIKPDLFKINSHLVRNEGATLSSGEKLWGRANRVIAGGNMLLSKKPKQFLQKGWPTYFNKSKGCFVWDLDNKKYIDISLMGVGTNILGYSNSRVDNAVMKAIKLGNMSTLNAPEEVFLAEKMLELHTWAGKVRFARSGGEINAVAIRLARAATGNEKIAFCGYHGWHDWYLSANLKDSNNLNKHLFTGLKTAGVPNSLINNSFPFMFNNVEDFKKLISENKFAAVIMEVMRNEPPDIKFLKEIRSITKKNNIVLIFDECTSGFRETLGGYHLKLGVYPDMATFGKTLGNGYAITSLLGSDEVMNSFDKTFISSTFWTERIGSVAALETIKIMEEQNIPNKILNISTFLRQNLQFYAKKHDLNINFFGMPSLTRFTIDGYEETVLKTFFSSYFLNNSFLASNIIYVSIAHKKNILEKYFGHIDKIFKNLVNNDNAALKKQLKELLANEGIKRMN